jgi:hypothetical protein
MLGGGEVGMRSSSKLKSTGGFVFWIFVAFAAWRALHVGDLGVVDSWIAARHAARPFDSLAWKSAAHDVRGEMLTDLVRRHRFAGGRAKAVTDLLGPSECYAYYDDMPCYYVQFEQTKYRLVFSVNHSERPGTIIFVDLDN